MFKDAGISIFVLIFINFDAHENLLGWGDVIREAYLRAYLVGAGLAEPDGVRVDPFGVFVAEPPTESLEGLDGVDVVTRRVGILDVPSSGKSFIPRH